MDVGWGTAANWERAQPTCGALSELVVVEAAALDGVAVVSSVPCCWAGC